MPHIRRDKKKLASGEERVYVAIAHNVVEKPDGKQARAKPVILARLGHEDQLDEGTVDGILDALTRYKRKRFGDRSGAEVAAALSEVAGEAEAALRVVASRDYGLRVIVEHVWKALELDRVLGGVAKRHALTWDLERVVFAMVLHRLVDPGSKLACNDWVGDEAWFPEAEGWDVHHFYRALDHLDAHADQITESLRVAAAEREMPDPHGLVMRLLDTTSSYFEVESDDEERAEGDAEVVDALRMRGKSKDHRPDKPQVVLGTVSDREGRLLAERLYTGNTNDQRVTLDLVRLSRTSWPEGRVVVACDSGMGGTANLKELDALGVDRVSGVPLRSLAKAEEMLCRKGRWREHPDKGHFRYRVMKVAAEDTPTGREELWVATRNLRDRKRVLAKLKRQEKKVRDALARDSRCDAHGRPMCKVLANRTLGRFVTKTNKTGKLTFDRKRMQLERRRAGVKVIRSTLTDLEPLVSLEVYDSLLKVEAGYRTLKSVVKLRPMYHRVPRRIRGHALVCTLALRVLRELELRTGRSLGELGKIFRGHRATQLVGERSRHWQRPDWSEEAAQVLEALGVAPGKAVWGVEALRAGSNAG